MNTVIWQEDEVKSVKPSSSVVEGITLHISSSLNLSQQQADPINNNMLGLKQKQQIAVGDADTVEIPHQMQQEVPFWEDLEPYQPVTAKAYWRLDDANLTAIADGGGEESQTAVPRGMWKRSDNVNAPDNEWVPEVEVVLQLANVHIIDGPLLLLGGIWATKMDATVDKHGNVPPKDLLLYPPGVTPTEDSAGVITRGTWTLPAGRNAEWPPLTKAAKSYKAKTRFVWQTTTTTTSANWEPQVATVYTSFGLVGNSMTEQTIDTSTTMGVWKLATSKKKTIHESELVPTMKVTIHPISATEISNEQQPQTWGIRGTDMSKNDGEWTAKDIWFLPPTQVTAVDGMHPRGKWMFHHDGDSMLFWPPFTNEAKSKRLGNLPSWPLHVRPKDIVPKTATVYSEHDDQLSQYKAAKFLQGIWKLTKPDALSDILWDPQYLLVYPLDFELDTSIPHGLWGISANAKLANGVWNAPNVWFLAPNSNCNDFIPYGQWAYSPTKKDKTWPPLPSPNATRRFKKVAAIPTFDDKIMPPPMQSPPAKAKAPLDVPKQRKEASTKQQQEKDQGGQTTTSLEETGLNSPKFLSRNTAAAAALKKKREIEKRYSGNSNSSSLQQMAEAAKRRPSPQQDSAAATKALLKKRILERRYSSTSHKEQTKRTTTTTTTPTTRYSSSETLRLSENTKSMLEASSALIASIIPPPSPPLPTIESSPVPVNTRKNTTTTTAATPTTSETVGVSKVQLVESLLAEQGSLLVLCTESPDSRTMSLDQDNALLLCYDVPDYEILYIESEPALGQELLQVSQKSIYPQFFYEPLQDDDDDDDSDSEDEFGGDYDKKDDKKCDGQEKNSDQNHHQQIKYIYLGGFATVRAMLSERMSFQYRSNEKEERRKRFKAPVRSKSMDI